jgi:SAM-dependent methyltransferase
MPFPTLPASFRFPSMVTEVAEDDAMYDGRDGHYISAGLSALRAIEDALDEAPAPPRRILDLPCGHGRVTRVLRARFPEAAITVCDLDRGGVDFAATRFGARGVYSVEDFRALNFGESYDLIWVGSLVTHLPEQQTLRFLDCMARHMTPRSVLVVSSHGGRVEARLRSWNYGLDRAHVEARLRSWNYGVAPEAVSGLLEDHARTGYGYRDYPGGQGYGVSLISREWVAETLSGGPLRLQRYSEAAWDDHQDVIVMRLREGEAGWSAPRHGTTEAAAWLHRAVPQSEKPWPGQGLRVVIHKAAQAVSARLGGRSHGGRDDASAPAARPGECRTMDDQPTPTHEAVPADVFDEAWYLVSYPDVAEAVARGEFASGRAHYLGYGRREGRLPAGAAASGGAAAKDAPGAEDATAAGFNEAWYLARYPDVAEAVRRGDLGSGLEHYLACGRQEGRFPSLGYQDRGRARPSTTSAVPRKADDLHRSEC